MDLEEHGWKGCKIPHTLEDVALHLPTWRHLQVLRPPETYGSRMLRLPYEPLFGKIMPAYQFGEQIDEGTYGKIIKTQRALYTQDPHIPTKLHRIEEYAEIVTKVNDIICDIHDESEYEEEVQALLHEASLHALAYHTLARHNFPHSIPRLYEVFATSRQRTPVCASEIQSVLIGMEFVQGETLHSYFDIHFQKATRFREQQQNTRLLIDILIQLCIYLDILQTDLRFNHRDLKINNVLRRSHSSGWSRALEHPALQRPWIAQHDLVIIDFGFACVACDDSPKSLVQAGSWFKPKHDCLKRGRDLALFLHCLQAYYPLQERVTASFLQLLQTAATVAGVGLLDRSFNEEGEPLGTGPIEFGDGIYRFLRRDDVDVPGCAPTALLTSLSAYRERKNEVGGSSRQGQETSAPT